MRYIKLLVAALILSLSTYSVSAQTDYKWKKYYMEAGILGGGSYYLGDANKTPFNYMLPTGGLFLKYKFDGRWEAKLQSTVGQAGIGEINGVMRNTTFLDFALLAEFNFFNYASMRLEPGSSRVTPYIFAGLGMSLFNKESAPIVPFGLGMKWYIADRLNLGLYWSTQKVIYNDNFDLIDNPLKLKKGFWINNDWYSTLAVYFSVNFWEVCPTCIDGRGNKKRSR